MDASTRKLLVSALLVLALLQVTPVFSSEAGGKKGVTLAFVIDTTGSMANDISQVKVGAQAIFKTLLDHPDKPIYNYVLVPFNDPSVGPVTVSTDHVLFNKTLSALTVIPSSKNRDCPEQAIAGIKLAVEESLPGSYIYVFTDAGAKDDNDTTKVEDIIQRKKCQVVFVLTGVCKRKEGHEALQSIASTASGQVFNIQKDEVKKVLAYVESSVQERNKVSHVAEHKSGPAKSEFVVPVDPTMDNLTVSLTGKDRKMEVTDPDGIKREGDEILNVPQVLVVKISHPKTGNWSVETESSSEHDIRITSVSEFSFTYGFSTGPTHNMAETAPRPLKGVDTALLVKATNQTQLSHLTKLLVKDLSGTTLHELNLVAVPGEPHVYMMDMFTPPTSLFILEVHGVDKTDKPIIRLSPTAISPQSPAPPIVTMPASVTATKNTPYTVKCHVESLVPFTATWLKNGRGVGPEESFKQSDEVLLHLATPTKSSEGKYTCHAKNVAGTTSQDTQLTITDPPPQVETPDKLRVRPGEKGEVPCRVESELDYTVSWARVLDTGDPHPVSGSRFVAKTTGTLVIELVETGDQGWYQCTAQSKVGKGEGRVHVEVREPVHVSVIPDKLSFMRGTSITLSCLATGSPKLTLQWRKDGQTIENSDPRLRESAKDTLDLMLKHTDISTEGRYECEAKNDVDKELVYEEKPTATAVQTHILALKGTSAQLQCTVTGVPKPVLTWSINGNEIVSDGEFEVLADGSLSIPAVARDGDFQCIARNKVGGDDDAVTLEVGTAPQIVEVPHDVSVNFITDGSVPCNVIAHPKPTITWRRRDDRKMDPVRFSYNDSCTLTITAAAVEDKGTYVVTAVNKFGKEETETEITITGIPPPPKVETPDKLRVRPGQKGEVPCRVESELDYTVSWARVPDTGHPSPVSGLRFEDGKTGNLVIDLVEAGDQGLYLCTALSKVGKGEGRVYVEVREPIHVSVIPDKLSFMRGTSIKLSCVVTGWPKPTLQWRKDGRIIEKSDGRLREPAKDTLDLMLEHTDSSTEGRYECEARNDVDKDVGVAELVYQEKPTATAVQSHILVLTGTSTLLQCTITGVPKPVLTWSRDGKRIVPDKEFKVLTDRSLSIPAVALGGDFKCIARNTVGEAEDTVTLEVGTTPKIVEEPHDVGVEFGSSGSVPCNVAGHPKPTVTWTRRDGTKIDSERFSYNDSCTLTITGAAVKDEAMYVVTAKNKFGKEEKEVGITITRIPSPPQVVIADKQRVQPGKKGEVQCRIKSELDYTVSWDRVLASGHLYPVSGSRFVAEKTGNLVIDPVEAGDQGRYHCTAQSEVGKGEGQVYVEVREPVHVSVIPDKLSFTRGTSIKLSCVATGSPKLTLQWRKDGKTIKKSDARLREPAKDTLDLMLEHTDSSTEGRYECEARNDVDKGVGVADLVYEEKPTATAVQSHILVLTGTSVHLRCTITGVPKPVLTWSRDGKRIVPDKEFKVLADRSLSIPLLARGGDFQCIARNKVGVAKDTVTLEVGTKPRIAKEPHSVSVNFNTRGSIPCNVAGHPKPTITWRRRDGRNMDPMQFSYDDSCTLTIAVADVEDEGKYVIAAENKFGKDEKEVGITITRIPPRPLVKTPKMLTVQSSTKGEVPCQVDSKLDYIVSWSRILVGGDSHPVNGSRFVVKKTGDLVIDPVKAGDQGWYYCTAQSKVGKGSERVYIQVREPVHVIVAPDKLSFVRGTSIKLSCFATGSPKLTLQWKIDGRILKKSDPRLREPAKDTLDLMLEHTDSSTEGRYECEARNNVDKDVGVAKLVYEEKPTATAVQRHILVLTGTSALLQCTITGVPKPVLTWTENGKKIVTVGQFKVLANGSLSIPVVYHGGGFECIAKNKLGNAKDTVTMEVGTAPQIMKAPHVVGVDIMTEGSVPCNVAGHPKPTVTWRRRDGKKMDAIRFSYNDSCMLRITAATVEDEGTYVITARNTFGKEEKEIRITITGIVSPVLDKSGELNMSIVAGEFVELSCVTLEGNPPPIITWYKDGVQLNGPADGAELKANGSLIIPYMTLRNVGTYDCDASNVGGKTRKSMQMNILEPPTFSHAKRVLLKVWRGKDVQLPCVVQGKPKPMVVWTKDGAPLSPSTTVGRSPRDDSLLIKKASETDNGTYECVAKNTIGIRVKIIDLLVQDPPKITLGKKEMYPVKGKNFLFSCEVTAYPPAEVKWLKDGVPISADRIAHLENNSSISFIAGPSDSGRYECIATNKAGMDKREINVMVTEPPVFEEKSQKVIATAGQDITLPCYTDAFPPATYFWSSSPRITLDINAVMSSTLTLKNVQPKSAGVYTCQAENFIGRDQKTFYLKVNVPPKIHADFPDKKELIKGSDYRLSCSADGSPAPTITWKKDGKILAALITDEKGVLLIRAVTREDSGLYTCFASNSEGADHKNLVISVLVPPIIKDPEMAIMEVKLGKRNFLLSCPAIEADPSPTIQWLKDAHYLDTRKETAHWTTEDNGRALRRKKVTLEDAGVYTCEASNAAGSTRADITVNVLTKPRFTVRSPQPTLSKLQGHSITLDCSSTSYPPPKVIWCHNGHPLVDFKNPDMIWSLNNQVLQLSYVRTKDNGDYHCVVENKVATIERSFNLKVHGSKRVGWFKGSSWLSWSRWSTCSASCGRNEQVRVRRCKNEDVGCIGNHEEWKKCLIKSYPVDGGWSEWSPWTVCTSTCGSGQRQRFRKCNKPAPSKGKYCVGSKNQQEICNQTPCPINGGWSEWSDWEACGGPCISSTRGRTRECTEPVPAFGGADCKGSSIEHVSCTQDGCPVNGQWTDWSPWSPCSATCGPSIRQRSRTCSDPKPQSGGAPCHGDSEETEACTTSACDNIPLKAKIILDATLNGKTFTKFINVNVTDLQLHRTMEMSTNESLMRQSGWFPYLQFLMSPLPWSTAFQKDGASNGHALTKGQFTHTMHVHFDSGKELVVVHTGRKVNRKGVLRLQVTLHGEVPLFPLDTTVVMEPYEEDYVQTGPDKLFAASSNTLNADGLVTRYSWRKTITLGSDSTMPRLWETLSVWDIKEDYNSSTLMLSHKTSAAISIKPGSKSCPEGFLLSPTGPYCEDVDECSDRRLNRCHVTQTCKNFMGSYHCACPSGLQAIAIGAPCSDVDECLLAPPVCSHYCVNTEGSFKCLCPPGFNLLKNSITCSEINLVRRGGSGHEIKGPMFCPQGFEEVKGVCQEKNPCKNSPIRCTDNEVCIKINGLYRCQGVTCPHGYFRDRVTKDCLIQCNEIGAVCDTGAQLTQTLKRVILSPEASNLPAYRDLMTLKVLDEAGQSRPHTNFRIEVNEEGNPFRVRVEHRDRVLYSQVHLPAGKDYRVVVVALSYDDSGKIIQHSTIFSILIQLSSGLDSTFPL